MKNKTSDDWLKLVPEKYKLVIYDPDGWETENFLLKMEVQKLNFVIKLLLVFNLDETDKIDMLKSFDNCSTKDEITVAYSWWVEKLNQF